VAFGHNPLDPFDPIHLSGWIFFLGAAGNHVMRLHEPWCSRILILGFAALHGAILGLRLKVVAASA